MLAMRAGRLAARVPGCTRMLRNSDIIIKQLPSWSLARLGDGLVEIIFSGNLLTSTSGYHHPSALLSRVKTRSRALPPYFHLIIKKRRRRCTSRSEICGTQVGAAAELYIQQLIRFRIGGAILTNELDDLALSLSFLNRLGLFPVVLHGAGPQL